MTLLLTCQDVYGRERTLKLIEALRRGTLEEAALSALRTRLATLEEAWLGKVRSYAVPEPVTVTSEEDMPVLRQTNFAPPLARPGAGLEIRLVLEDAGGNLSARSVFIIDETTGRVFQAQASRPPATHLFVEMPIDPKRVPGRYTFRVVAVDEAGNLRAWSATYTVAAPTSGN